MYTGVMRSPVCAVARKVPYRDVVLPVAQELFATMKDVYLLMGDVPEDPTDCETADGKPATKAMARARLGRMICADEPEFHHKDAAICAESIAEDHVAMIAEALRPWLGDDRAAQVIISGAGEFLARKALQTAGHQGAVTSLTKELGSQTSSAATAHALAVLASEGRQATS